MKRASVFNLIGISIVALAGYNSANASPTFRSYCFSTEEAAKKHQSYYTYRDVDHSKAIEKDKKATAIIYREHVALSDLQAILGESEISVNEISNVTTHKWTLFLMGSPSASDIKYDPSNGYCVETRHAGCLLYTSPSPRDA